MISFSLIFSVGLESCCKGGVGGVGTSNELVLNAVAHVNAMLVEEGGKGGAFAHLFLAFFHTYQVFQLSTFIAPSLVTG